MSLLCQCSPRGSPLPAYRDAALPSQSPAPVYRSLPSKSGISDISWNCSRKAKARLWRLSGRMSSLCSPLFPASSFVGPLTQPTASLPPPSQPGLGASCSHGPHSLSRGRPPSLLLLFPLKCRPRLIKTIRAREHCGLSKLGISKG